MTTKRTTHRSKAGAKLYAKRDKAGKFTDIQRYSRAHAQDLRTRSLDECGVKVGLLIDAARWLRHIRDQPAKRRKAVELVCAASAAADKAIIKVCKARARKRA